MIKQVYISYTQAKILKLTHATRQQAPSISSNMHRHRRAHTRNTRTPNDDKNTFQIQTGRPTYHVIASGKQKETHTFWSYNHCEHRVHLTSKSCYIRQSRCCRVWSQRGCSVWLSHKKRQHLLIFIWSRVCAYTLAHIIYKNNLKRNNMISHGCHNWIWCIYSFGMTHLLRVKSKYVHTYECDRATFKLVMATTTSETTALATTFAASMMRDTLDWYALYVRWWWWCPFHLAVVVIVIVWKNMFSTAEWILRF